MKILAINPGSTSTKIAVYEDETPLLVRNIRHTVEELAVFPEVTDQFEFRKSLVLTELEKEGIPFRFDAIIGRGGLVKPISGGVYEVNEAMRQDTLHAMRTHGMKRILPHGLIHLVHPAGNRFHQTATTDNGIKPERNALLLQFGKHK